MMSPKQAVFLDRDGVLLKTIIRDGKPYSVTADDTAELMEGAAEACRILKSAGFTLVMITNQPDVVRGRTPRAHIEAVNAWIVEQLALDGLKVCFHDDADHCSCRKPAPGLILSAARDLGIDISSSIMVGDRWRDIEAGRRAGCRTVFVDHHYRDEPETGADHVVDSLLAAVTWVVARKIAP